MQCSPLVPSPTKDGPSPANAANASWLKSLAQAQSAVELSDTSKPLEASTHMYTARREVPLPPIRSLGDIHAFDSDRGRPQLAPLAPMAPTREPPSQTLIPPLESTYATDGPSAHPVPLRTGLSSHIAEALELFSHGPTAFAPISMLPSNCRYGDCPAELVQNGPNTSACGPTGIHSPPTAGHSLAGQNQRTEYPGCPLRLPEDILERLTRATGMDSTTLRSCMDPSQRYYCPLCPPSLQRWKLRTRFMNHLVRKHKN